MSDNPRTLVFSAFDAKETAGSVVKELKELKKNNVIDVDAWAVLEKDWEGNTHIKDTQGHDAKWGSLVGGLIGVLAGPVGAVAGATTGGLTGWLIGDSYGIPSELIDEMKEEMPHDTSAIVAIVDEKWVGEVEKEMEKDAKKVLKQLMK
jgi:uncharacterized membrane protein